MGVRIITKHYFISGRVQGVGFRAFTQSLAEEMSLIGWVRNLSDGRVEVLIRGPETTLEQFESRLRQGPAHGRVDFIEALEIQLHEQLKAFEVRRESE